MRPETLASNPPQPFGPRQHGAPARLRANTISAVPLERPPRSKLMLQSRTSPTNSNSSGGAERQRPQRSRRQGHAAKKRSGGRRQQAGRGAAFFFPPARRLSAPPRAESAAAARRGAGASWRGWPAPCGRGGRPSAPVYRQVRWTSASTRLQVLRRHVEVQVAHKQLGGRRARSRAAALHGHQRRLLAVQVMVPQVRRRVRNRALRRRGEESDFFMFWGERGLGRCASAGAICRRKIAGASAGGAAGPAVWAGSRYLPIPDSPARGRPGASQ